MIIMNNTIFYFFYSLAHQSLFLDKVIVFFAQTFAYIVIFLAIIFLLFHHDVLPSENPLAEFKKKWKEIILVFLAGISAWVVAFLLKIIIHSPRPFQALTNVQSLLAESDYSFPSSHATFFFALGTAIFLSHKKAGYWFIFFAILIGIARIASGVHFPVDIFFGFLLGFLISFLFKKFIK